MKINKWEILFYNLILVISTFCCNYFCSFVSAEEINNLNIYHINLDLLNNYDTLEKGSNINLLLLEDIDLRNLKEGDKVNLKLDTSNGSNFTVSGFIVKSAPGSRLSMLSSLELSTSKLITDDGQEINLSATSPNFASIHPPHANSDTLSLARTITNISLPLSPLTFGTSLGASFLVNGLLSAKQNGISDFYWGGLSGTGFSFAENLFRKQPDLFLSKGSSIPFILREDLRISKGIFKETTEQKYIKEEALEKINNLLKWGDLSGALELSIQAGLKDTTSEILGKISSDMLTNRG